MSNKISYIYVAQDKYSKVAQKIGRVTKKLRGIVDRTNPAFEKLSKKVDAAARSLKKAGVKLQEFGTKAKSAGLKLSAVATLPIALLGRSMIKAASDAEETESKFNVVFASVANSANAVAENLAKNYGLAGSQSRKLLGDTGDLLTGFGFTGKAALDISEKVNKLAVDLASFTNFSGGAEGASAALTKALLGERESVKSLGISILEEDVKKKVAILRAKGMRFETMRQAKAYATLAIAQEQSKNAIGDFARTSKGFANQQRILSARLLDLREKFGKLILPIALKLTHAFMKLADMLGSLSPTTQKIILIIGALVAVLGPLLLVVGGLITAWPLLVAGFIAITGPVGLIIAAFVALFALWAAAKNNFMGIGDVIGGTIESVIIWVDELKMKFDNMVTSIVDKVFLIQDKIATVKDFFSFGDNDVNINKRSENIIKGGNSRTDVNVNLRAPENAVQSVKSRTTGKTAGLNVGVNMLNAL